MIQRSRTITIVASELLGRAGTGGAGTADSLLAVALARAGHQVTLLIASGREIGPINAHWTQVYQAAGVDIRVLEPMRSVRPRYLAPPFEVLQALRERPPEVAIVNDWRGLGYAGLCARQTGRSLTETAFVMHCHGPGRVLSAFAQKVPDTVDRFGEHVIERASMQLVDAVVSPSEWLLAWMRDHSWRVPESARVIQYLRESTALDTPSPAASGVARIRRIAFFGQLREGKGIRIFLGALNGIRPELLNDAEILFLGSENRRWPASAISRGLPPLVRASARVETELPREAALAELRRPGTLAVMPSLLDNSPNTVAECIENGIPFVATATGGIPELVAEGDRTRVLCRPTADDLAATLTRALTDPGFEPARAARDPRESLDAWLQVVADVEPRRAGGTAAATRVAVVAGGEASERRARRLAESTRSVDVEIERSSSVPRATDAPKADWILYLDDDDEPDGELLDALAAAQAASGADIVTVAVRPSDDPGSVQLFVGDPGPLGLAENQYGVVGLVRASMSGFDRSRDAVDPDWPLFARLTLAGARIVSIPEPLSTHHDRPGRVTDVPGDGVTVLEAFEKHAGEGVPDLAQFAATLAAALEREPTGAPPPPTFLSRIRRRLGG